MNEKPGWREKLFGGFKKTSGKLTENLTGLITKGKLDAETLDEIEEALIVSDLGPATAAQIREKLASGRFEKGIDEAGIRQIVEDEIATILEPVAKPIEVEAFPRPQVILVIGVNGSGKTTTIAKLAHLFIEQDYGVMLAAGDTFRAAAIDQLKIWADRVGVPIVTRARGRRRRWHCVRCGQESDCRGHRRFDRRYRRPPAEPARVDGRTRKNPPRPWPIKPGIAA